MVVWCGVGGLWIVSIFLHLSSSAIVATKSGQCRVERNDKSIRQSGTVRDRPGHICSSDRISLEGATRLSLSLSHFDK